MRKLLAPFFGSAIAAAVLTVACGAQELEAPAPALKESAIQHCRDFGELMPNFVRAISTGRTENLKYVIEHHLLIPQRQGDVPPLNDVLRAIFMTLTRLAQKPTELGAPPGQYCVPTAPTGATQQPPIQQANELCEMRRALDVLVHQGKGIDAIKVVEPQLNAALNYMIGRGYGADAINGVATPHWELAGILSSMCAQDGNCQLSNGLDLVIAFADYTQTADGKLLADHLNALVASDGGAPALTSFLDPSSLSEDGMVAIVKAVIPAIQSADPTSLQQAIDGLPLPASTDGGVSLKQQLQPVVDDMKKILARPELMVPTRRSLYCFTQKDPDYKVVRMIYRLALRDKLPEFGLTRLTGVLQGIQDTDKRGSLVFIVKSLAVAVRNDEQAIDSAANVCRTMLSTATYPGQVRSNAELALPVITDLVAAGLIQEVFCAIDTLVFGCTGGAQPACVAR